MKRVLVVFRGLTDRRRNIIYPAPPISNFEYNQMVWINGLVGVNNWKEAVFKNLKDNNIDYDVAFITYSSPILSQLVKELKPKYLMVDGLSLDPDLRYFKHTGTNSTGQNSNLRAMMNFIGKHLDEYDRFIILRFDFEYKIRITEWPKWNEPGITLTNKNTHWERIKFFTHFYEDFVITFDSNRFQDMKDAIFCIGTPPYSNYPHEIGKYLYDKNIPFNLMYEDYYTITNHPLHSYITWEESPDLNNYRPGIRMPPVLNDPPPSAEQIIGWAKEFGKGPVLAGYHGQHGVNVEEILKDF